MTGSKAWKEPRQLYCKRIDFVCPDSPDSVFEGMTENISYSGLCFSTQRCLGVGQQIMIKTSLPFTSRKAIVRWVKKLSRGIHLVGLKMDGCYSENIPDLE